MVKYISPVNILFVSKTSSRHLQDMSSRRLQDMSSRRLEDVFSVTIFCLPTRLQDLFARRLGRPKIVTIVNSFFFWFIQAWYLYNFLNFPYFFKKQKDYSSTRETFLTIIFLDFMYSRQCMILSKLLEGI